jgi:hypothetical protein
MRRIGIPSTMFLTKAQDVNLVMRKYSTNPNGRTFEIKGHFEK